MAQPTAPKPAATGTYLTDGRALYRVVAPLRRTGRHGFALLEDCYSLDVLAFTAGELSKTALTVVTPAPHARPAR